MRHTVSYPTSVSHLPSLPRRRFAWSVSFVLTGAMVAFLASCSSSDTEVPSGAYHSGGSNAPRLITYQVEKIFSETEIERPTLLTHAGDGLGRIFVMSQLGKIFVFHPDGLEARDPSVFLDLSERVEVRSEQGMIGLAFDPSFSENGHFYVHYSADPPRRGVISRFTVDASDPDRGDIGTELVLLEVPQPFINHNGGMLAFGPDEYLYIGLGDGGGGGDPSGNAQDPGTLLGSMLRVDIFNSSAELPYSIPADNPFASGDDGRPEIWAYGFRNPWRFSFDRATGDLWVADVGQNAWEEVNIVTKGGNYGWNIMEAGRCYPLNDLSCDYQELTDPIVGYTHADGCSVIGGYVYRGSRITALNGVYIYGDFCSGKLWGVWYDGQSVIEHAFLAETGLALSSFGEDEAGEVYLLDYAEGGIYRLAFD
jgi:glucose/arabinose dehydrogenase